MVTRDTFHLVAHDLFIGIALMHSVLVLLLQLAQNKFEALGIAQVKREGNINGK